MSRSERADPTRKPQSPPEVPAAARQEKTEAKGTPLALAERLLAAGIPVVVCHPCPGYGKPGKCSRRGHEDGKTDVHIPTGWNTVTAAECDLSGFRPGKDALALVGGHGIDLVDVDTKVGGSVEHLPPFKSYGETGTPSGGGHYVVPSSGFGKIGDWKTEAGFVGDYVGGTPEGKGRLLGFLPGSTRPKYPGVPYVEAVEWDVEACVAADPDPALVEALEAAGGSRERRARPAVDNSPPRDPALGVHPYAAKAIEAELSRLDQCDLLGHQGPGWNNTTHAVACNLIEFANSPWSGYTMEQAHADLVARAPSDEGFGPTQHDTCWESALGTVDGKGRPRPDGDPADDFDAVAGGEPRRLDVTNTSAATEWLRQEIGRQGTPLAGLFRRGGGLVHTPRIDEDGYVPLTKDENNEDGPAQVQPVDAARLRAWVQFSGYNVQRLIASRKKWEPTTFPAEAANLVVAAVEKAPNLRLLDGVTHTPMLRRDGTVLSEEGYDTASRRLYLPERDMTVERVPDEPSLAEVDDARDLISFMLAEFDFVTDHDRANYLALLFTPLMRVMVPPPYPLGLIHAHQRGSGKGYLATILRTLHGGALRALPESDAEMRKQITTILSVTTAPVVQFDNVTRLSSSVLDLLLTSPTWDDRVLGLNVNFSGQNDRLWVATGNNVAIGGDLLRRVRWINIDPNTPNPEQRTGFAIPDLPGWVQEKRGELLVALLTLLRAWVVAGKPLGPEVGSDSFTRWTRAMQGVLGVAGWPGTVGHVETVRQDSNDEEAEWGAFLAAVWAEHEDKPWKVKDMLVWVEPDDLPEGMNAQSARSAGMWLKNRKGKWAGDYVLRPAGDDNGTALWKVQRE